MEVTQIQNAEVVNVFSTVKVPQAPLDTAKPLSRDEHRWRKVLLSKVQQFWIDGVLAKSLHSQVLIELGLEERNNYVYTPLEGVEEFPPESKQAFPEGTSATHIFEDIGAGRTLLILGEPGAGKTISLLKLAESLISRTEADLNQPLPVVLNLSSWSRQRKSIEEWLVEELFDKYTVSKSLGKSWIVKEQLILLLDGLDEVEAKHRNDCVHALNQFLQAHGRTEMVVCSRIHDYEALSDKVTLRSAIYVKPLTPQQIDEYLEQAGESLIALRAIVNQNSEIKSFASSPLILSIMSLAYQGSDWDNLPRSVTSEIFRQRLFDTYIKRMFQRKGTTRNYLQEQATLWLIWLAQEMSRTSQTVFLIERIQPSFFQTKFQKLRYRLESGLISWLFFGLFFGLIFGLLTTLSSWLIFGLLLELKFASTFELFSELRYQLFQGLKIGLSYGLIIGLIVGFSGNIKTVETLKWSWREAKSIFRKRLILGLILGPILGLLVALSFEMYWGLINALIEGLILGLRYGLILGLLSVVIGGLRGPDMLNTFQPNQGIWKSAINALNFGANFGVILGVILGVIEKSLLSGVFFGVSAGLFFGLIGGGTTCLRHFTLRLMLYRMGHIPWNYARFLDYAADRLFLQKVGGGYIFVHRMLLEHFASMELESHQQLRLR
ncbi:conserved hypothetical protein (plasmid) [Acaryochloris marina MBIC11017]|uniref:NACHT domain-containing protein n=1 Tax=Acaryochloris marina (strain MBIC 11017) TaxID=329726 RepID=A8ZPU8_ACAM1|nr:conserved hypothetical protein [Acaryochloris marina MBIC11017]